MSKEYTVKFEVADDVDVDADPNLFVDPNLFYTWLKETIHNHKPNSREKLTAVVIRIKEVRDTTPPEVGE